MLIALGISAYPLAAAPRKNKKLSPAEAQAQGLLENAKALTDIAAPGSPPFVIIARARLEFAGKSTEGMYGMSWDAPDRFREVFSFPDYRETDVVIGDKYYRQRSSSTQPLLVAQLETLLRFPLQWRVHPAAKLGKIDTLQNGGKESTCIQVAKFPGTDRFCIATASNELVSFDSGIVNPLLESGVQSNGRFEFDHYATVGTKRFPEKLTLRRNDGMFVEADIQQISLVRSFLTTEFQPPVGAQETDWCTDPKTSGQVSLWPLNPLMIWVQQRKLFSQPKGFFAAYLAIGPDGNVKHSQVLYSLASKMMRSFLAGSATDTIRQKAVAQNESHGNLFIRRSLFELFEPHLKAATSGGAIVGVLDLRRILLSDGCALITNSGCRRR